MVFYNNTELYHHGIKGQRWGVRRFQNEDGSLTPKGKKRQKIMEEASDKAKRFIGYAKDDTKEYTKYRDKYVNDSVNEYGMSKKEALHIMNENIRISKRQAERYKKIYDKYRNMDVATISKKDLKEAKKFVKKAFHTNANYAWYGGGDYNGEDHD